MVLYPALLLLLLPTTVIQFYEGRLLDIDNISPLLETDYARFFIVIHVDILLAYFNIFSNKSSEADPGKISAACSCTALS